MTANRQTSDSPRLPPSVQLQIADLADEFASTETDVEDLSLASYLNRVKAAGRPQLLEALVDVSLQKMRQQAIGNPVACLLDANPELSDELGELLQRTLATVDQREESTVEDLDEGQSGGSLNVRCPHCHAPIAMTTDSQVDSICCPSCGSDFSLIDDREQTHDAAPITELGHFRLIERVGMGAFGEVWKAHDTELDRTVAVKVPRRGELDEKQERSFLREAQNAASLNHPGIVPVYEVGRDDQTLYIVSEFVRGVSLAEWLTGQQLTSREAADLALRIATALGHAHKRGIVHRDLKPGNVMIDGEGEPRLMDFGLARRAMPEATVTYGGQLIGTPAYMSPEQAEGEGASASPASDVYSLGVVLFQLLTGELPFRGSTRMLLHQVLHDEPPSPRKLNANVPRDLETITLKCLDKAPHRRYQSAEEVAAELRRWLRSEPILARPASFVYRTRRWCQRNRVAVSWATAVFLLLTLATIAMTGLWARANHAKRQAEIARAEAVAAQQAVQQKADELRQQAERLRAAHLKIAELAEQLVLLGPLAGPGFPLTATPPAAPDDPQPSRGFAVGVTTRGLTSASDSRRASELWQAAQQLADAGALPSSGGKAGGANAAIVSGDSERLGEMITAKEEPVSTEQWYDTLRQIRDAARSSVEIELSGAAEATPDTGGADQGGADRQ